MATEDARKALDRIVKLVRLAANNPSEEEARTAAVTACRMMVKHEVALRIGSPQALRQGPNAPTPPPPAPLDIHEFLRMRDEVFRDIKGWEQAYWDGLTERSR